MRSRAHLTWINKFRPDLVFGLFHLTTTMSMSSHSGPGVMVAQSLPPELSRVVQLVDSSPESLARGDMGMHTAALAAAQLIYKISMETEKSAAAPISKLLSGLSPEASAPTTRAQKRKRDEVPKAPLLTFRPTPKAGRYVDGLEMSTSKLWAMMEHRTGPLCGILEAVVAPENIIEEEDEEEEEEESEEGEPEFELGEEDEGMSGLSDEDEEDEDEDEDEGEDEGGDEDEEYESDDGESVLGDTTMELSRTEDHSDLDLDSDSEDAEEAQDDEEVGHDYLRNIDLDRAQNPQKVAQRRAHPTLDDAFFSIDDFNRETEALEAQNRSSGALNEDDEDEDDEDVDLFMDVQDIEDTPQEANDPKYQDFFAPVPKSKLKSKKSPEKPRRKVKLLVASPPEPKRSTKVRFSEEVKVRNIKSKRTKASLLAELMEAGGDDEEEGEGPWASDMLEESVEMDSDDGDGDEEMGSDVSSDVEPSKNDLFADDDEENESEAGLSTHQKRLAALSAEIQALEAENVAPKPWTMQGEATSRSRPQNALLEADLEFEHVGKVVPIVTEESVKSLEEMIKARIIEGRYDDVVRKRDVETKPFLPSRMFELKDTQSEKSLAQIYEDEYTAAASGSKPVDDRDGKLAESHKEITELWDGICYKLDALSNAHFTPKQASFLGSLLFMIG
ncbi:unnamed protein product [Rhizoctonia solani]|uniref:Uncharacterized protein n=1 Tax=Rhizoctonia solani TaxID=456999 RepID=A0A8H2W5Y6_9AGAM|nr:unnamed protein product [Rhizoctonia solani]